jgi:NADP-reducing hydrogenase subunit HndA
MGIECCGCISEKEQKLKEVIEKYKNTKGALIPVLHEAQEIFGYLSMSVQKIISEGLDIPLTEIYGVVTFYAQFSLKPKGKNRISVCMGTACYVKGAGQILKKLQEKLGIDIGEVTEDGLFSLDACRCVGACGLAPVMMINDEVYGRLTPDNIEDILKKYENEMIET